MNQKEKKLFDTIMIKTIQLLTTYNPDNKTFAASNRMKYLGLLAMEILQDAEDAIRNKDPWKAYRAYKKFKLKFSYTADHLSK